MNAELEELDFTELANVAFWTGVFAKDEDLDSVDRRWNRTQLADAIRDRCGARSDDEWRARLTAAAKLYKIKASKEMSTEYLRSAVYDAVKTSIEAQLAKLSPEERQDLDQLISAQAGEFARDAKRAKLTRTLGAKATVEAGTVGAVMLWGNLGLSIAFVNGLALISSIIGVTFPFAAYIIAAKAGAIVGGPIGAAAIALGGAGYFIVQKRKIARATNAALVAYLLEVHKRLMA